MPDQERKLNIKVIATADTLGFQQTSAALEDLTGKTGKAGESAKTAAKEGFDKLELSGREARMMIDRLIPGVEGLGHLLTSLLSPVAAVGFAIVVAKNLFEEYNKTLDETAKKNAEANFSDVLTAMREGATATKESLAQFHYEVTKTADETDRLKTALEDTLKLMHQTAESEAAHGRAMGEDELAQAERTRQEHMAEISARSRALETAKARQPGLVAAADAAEQLAGADKTKKDVANKELPGFNRVLPDLMEKMNVAQVRADALNRDMQRVSDKYGLGMTLEQIKAWNPTENAEAEFATKAYERVLGGVNSRTAIVSDVNTLQEKAKDARSEADKNKQFIAKESHDIPLDQELQEGADFGNRRVALDKMSVGGGYTGADVERASGLELAKATGQRQSQQDQQWLAQFEKFMQERGVLSDRLLTIMHVEAAAHTSLQQRVNDLDIMVRQIFARANSGTSGPGPGG